MKAILFPKYGSPDYLQVVEMDKPVPNDDQVLIRVHAASVNPMDWHRVVGMTLPMRVIIGLMLPKIAPGVRAPRNPHLGGDVAGTVAAVGQNVTGFSVGDEVFGGVPAGFAEYALAGQPKIVRKPATITFEEAAAAPVVGCTALQGLRDAGQLQAGERVLINGAAGGIGTFSVMIAKAWGAQVTAVCSTRNVEMLRSIGADQVIDYTREDFTRTGQQYDLIYDTVGNRSVSDLRRVLNPQGRCVITGFSGVGRLIERKLMAPIVTAGKQQRIGGQGMAKIEQRDLLILRELLESGAIKPVIDRCYALSETADALRLVGSRHAQGKVIVKLV